MMARVLGTCILAAAIVACASEPRASTPVERGRQVYAALECGSCHEAGFRNFFRRVGPPLEHVGTAAAQRRPGMSAEEYLRESITDPGAYVVQGYPDAMPRGLARDLSPEDLAALIAYLASLR
jgi:cytochrome c553